MVRNRFFKNTMGYFAELAIVAAVDASDGTAVVAQPSVVTLPLTVAGSPTAGDILTLTFSNGLVAEFTAPATPTTALLNAGVVATIKAILPANASVTSLGTTSQVISIGVPGTSYNAVTITPSETGSSWTVGSAVTFAGGLAADAVAADNHEDFVASGTAGTIWAFWDDTAKQTALVAGDTTNPANINRKFFYAWKDADGTPKKSTSIPIREMAYSQVAYSAGVAQVTALTFAGTYSATQIVHIRIIDTTATQTPYASYDYSEVIGSGGINTATTNLAAKINAEKNEPIATAGASTNVLTITASTKYRTFKVVTFVELSPTQLLDASAPTQTTTKNVQPIGTSADVAELYKYYVMNSGGTVYAGEGVNASEFGLPSSNVVTGTQYGFLLVTSKRNEDGAVRNYSNKAYILIAVVTGDVAKLAAL